MRLRWADRLRTVLAFGVICLLLVACAPVAVSAGDGTRTAVPPTVATAPGATASGVPDPAASAVADASGTSPTLVLPTSGATITPRLTVEASRTPLAPCADPDCREAAGHLWLVRPIPNGEGYINYVDRSYPYASTQGGQREPHHGVEFFNRAGTPVHAASEGEVVVAGTDDTVAYGPATRFYGNLVVIRHLQTYEDQTVYTLYGHLRSVTVAVGQTVRAGELIGTVGSTGVAIGAHLHFEVRLGANDYASSRNPELWLKPLPNGDRPQGVLAGRVLDADGHWLPELTVVIRPLSTEAERPRTRYIQTYADDNLLNADDRLQENFAVGDLPAGIYSVSVSTTKFYQQTISVTGDNVAWVSFVVNPPQTSADLATVATPPDPTDEASPAVETPTLEATAAGSTATP